MATHGDLVLVRPGRHTVHAVATVIGTRASTKVRSFRLAAAVEADSEHPLARAIVAAATTPERATGFRALAGHGVRPRSPARTMRSAGRHWSRSWAVDIPADLRARTVDWAGTAILYVFHFGPDGRAEVLGALSLADSVRPQAYEAVTGPRAAGVSRIVMVTGDAAAVADAVAAELGIDEVHAEVLPADKDATVAGLQRRGRRVAMVGDGVNDAPALARAEVGIAIGAGTDVAIESAGVVLASSDPRGVLAVRRLSAASYRKMVQNLVWAAGYNVVALPSAPGALAWAGVALSPAVGAIAMSASTIVVALNAQLLRQLDLGTGRT